MSGFDYLVYIITNVIYNKFYSLSYIYVIYGIIFNNEYTELNNDMYGYTKYRDFSMIPEALRDFALGRFNATTDSTSIGTALYNNSSYIGYICSKTTFQGSAYGSVILFTVDYMFWFGIAHSPTRIYKITRLAT